MSSTKISQLESISVEEMDDNDWLYLLNITNYNKSSAKLLIKDLKSYLGSQSAIELGKYFANEVKLEDSVSSLEIINAINRIIRIFKQIASEEG